MSVGFDEDFLCEIVISGNFGVEGIVMWVIIGVVFFVVV